MTTREWRTSSLSREDSNNCVEVAPLATAVAVRDSKDRDGGTLAVSPAAWRAFVGAARADDGFHA